MRLRRFHAIPPNLYVPGRRFIRSMSRFSLPQSLPLILCLGITLSLSMGAGDAKSCTRALQMSRASLILVARRRSRGLFQTNHSLNPRGIRMWQMIGAS